MEPLTLLVTYTTRPAAAQAFLAAVSDSGVLEQIRREDGCLGYDYFLPAQGEDQLLLVERWASAQQQAVHLRQPHMEQLLRLKDRFVLETRVERLTAAHAPQ